MRHGGTGWRCLETLVAILLLSPIRVPDALANELERMRERYDLTLRVHEKRITEIEARGRGASADPRKRADGITRDRVAEIRASLKGGGGGASKRLTELAEKASGDAKALGDVYSGQSEHLDVLTGEWESGGAERKKLTDAITALQKNLALTKMNLAMAAEAAAAMEMSVQQLGVLEQVARIEAGASEARERLSARWERDRILREREREQREREAAERARGLR